MTDSAVSGSSHVRLRSLRIRQDGGEWIVGRAETGIFIAIPEIGIRVIRDIEAGRSLADIGRELQIDHGKSVDVVAFVVQLIDRGFVAAVDGRPLPQAPPPARPSLAWLRPRHVRWAVSPVLVVIMGAVVILAASVLVLGRDAFPSYRELFWSPYESLVLLGQIATTWGLIFFHELGHLITARAVGVSGRIRLGTRLQFLVAQTDVSGIWAEPRRYRLTVYLAGMAADVTAASVAIIVMAALRASGAAVPYILPSIVLTVATMMPLQFLVFMRTDVYFVIQDLARCRNLYADGAAYFRYLISRFLLRRAEPGDNPIRAHPRRERIAVRCYAALLVTGTAGCLVAAGTITLPFYVRLMADAVRTIVQGSGVTKTFDSSLVALILTTFELLWAFAWWRRHGARIRRRFQRSGPSGDA